MERIKSKIDALVYAIESTKTKMGVDLKKAVEVYELIVNKVELPDAGGGDYHTDLLDSFKNVFGISIPEETVSKVAKK